MLTTKMLKTYGKTLKMCGTAKFSNFYGDYLICCIVVTNVSYGN